MCTTHSTQDAHVEIVGTFLFSFSVSSKLNTSLMGFFFYLKGCLTHNPGRFSVLWQRLAGDWDQVAPEQLLDELTQPPNEAERCNTRGHTATHIHRRVQIDYSENTASLQSWEVIQWNICRDTRCVGPTRSPKKSCSESMSWETENTTAGCEPAQDVECLTDSCRTRLVNYMWWPVRTGFCNDFMRVFLSFLFFSRMWHMCDILYGRVCNVSTKARANIEAFTAEWTWLLTKGKSCECPRC